MDNLCELLINVVSDQQAKDADKPEPKGMGYGRGVRVSPRAAVKSPGGQAGPKSSDVFSAERGNPVSLPLGKRAARQADGDAGRGGRRKRTPPCNEADRGSEFAPARKGADFRLVLNHEKGLGRLNRKGTDRQWSYTLTAF
ncbi:hypothetical protein DENIS_4501 [Desulfonema ishimotonii]|uniref:Uncharacterized protein n=1 Tax=Desulfonema ishimotonii TaxID=45657 RepID=A0A401FXY3_9BACT|nr:hypothetical protein DENIS_0323 [Desulfonema ishimotonii]GBC61809.1 hypothetical protein DENIS_2771 [Desulfonema ishimotonii]GBC63507.1 hypothetical protein DENIS_4501 [Desulfonema ishimotonii]